MQNEILTGDCLEIMQDMADNSVDLVLTDPPYGVRKTEAWDARELFLTRIKLWLNECLRVSKTGVVWFCASSMLPHILPGYEEYFQRLLIWDKPPGSQFAGAMHNKLWYSMEPILVFDKNNLTKKGKEAPYSYSTFQARTIPKKKYGHPTTKPLELISWLIEHYSDEGDVILDPFLGSGTTAVAALNTGRFFIGIEQEPEHVQTAKNRVQEAILKRGA